MGRCVLVCGDLLIGLFSCSSCLQSDGVCGWCNVEKRCTAVTSSCSNGISVS